MRLNKEPARIQKMFAEVAANYDRTNTILSLGIHHRWKMALVRAVAAVHPHDVLDCATGTGDVAIELKKKLPRTNVTGVDFCAEMIERAPAKAAAAGGLEIQFQTQDVTALSFADETFDALTISFGIRNVEKTALGISEMKRVLRPGGSLFILEFGRPKPEPFARAYDFYSEKCLPKIGGFLSGQKTAYEYLQKSSAAFPSGEKFIDQFLRIPGFCGQNYMPLSFGIAALYSTVKNERKESP